MGPDDELRPGRQDTDESLRTEREQADRAMIDRQQAVADGAARVVQRARDEADAVVDVARATADLAADPGATRPGVASVAQARRIEDRQLLNERAVEDLDLREQRDDDMRRLLQLLPLERDATDRHLFTERARSDASLANRDDFLGMVSHDLRSLLSGIVLSATQLAESAAATPDGQPVRTNAARIHRYAARMNRLIGDLLDIASIDAGQLAMTPRRGDVDALMAEAVETFHGAATDKGLTLRVEPGAGPVFAMFDHDRILQVLANLIANSIKFTPSGGAIALRCERGDDDVRVVVHDTGAGIRPELLESVFERFWQVGKNDRRGLGLGLYISRCIVEAHGGVIQAASTPGQGSTFTFTLRPAA